MNAWQTDPLLLKLALCLLGSLWQFGAGWLIYRLLTIGFDRIPPRRRFALALLILGGSAAWSAGSFLFRPSGILPATFPDWIDRRIFSGLALLYLALLLVRVLRWLFGFRSVWLARRSDVLSVPDYLAETMNALRAKLGIVRRVRIWLSKRIDTPQALGFFRPVILLPVAMLTELSPLQVETILLHELEHIRRGDYAFNLFITAIKAVFFFNPFALKFVRILERERELACDDAVLRQDYPAGPYASALVSLEWRRLGAPAPGIPATAGPKYLLQRVRRICGLPVQKVRERKVSRWLPALLAVFAFFLAGTPAENRPTATAIVPVPVSVALLPATPASLRVRAAVVVLRKQPRKTEKKISAKHPGSPAPSDILPPAAPDEISFDAEQAAEFARLAQTSDFTNAQSQPNAVPAEAAGRIGPFVPSSSFVYTYNDSTQYRDALEAAQKHLQEAAGQLDEVARRLLLARHRKGRVVSL